MFPAPTVLCAASCSYIDQLWWKFWGGCLVQGCTVEISFLHCCTPPLNRVQPIILLNNALSRRYASQKWRFVADALREVVRMPERSFYYCSLLRSESGAERVRWQAPVFQKATKYIGVRLDRTLNFKQTMKKLRPRLHILGVINACLTGTTWWVSVIILRISTQALVFSAAWIGVTVWSRTPHVKVDVNINSAIRTISGSQANSCVSAPSPKRDCPAGYPRKAAILILAMEATKHY